MKNIKVKNKVWNQLYKYKKLGIIKNFNELIESLLFGTDK